jgi:hypothetical protein
MLRDDLGALVVNILYNPECGAIYCIHDLLYLVCTRYEAVENIMINETKMRLDCGSKDYRKREARHQTNIIMITIL